jgi:hypothetical protein
MELRGEHRIRMFNNIVLRKLFGLKKYELKGQCGRLQNEELYDLYSSPNFALMI